MARLLLALRWFATAALVSAAAMPAMPATPATPAGGAVAAKPIRCPRIATNESRPPKPSPPPPNPYQRAIGGAALDTSGLVVPGGVRPPPATTATSWLVADLDTGAVLGACGPHEHAAPASVQKLLLAATFLAKLDPRQIVTVTAEDLDIPPDSSMVGLVTGGRYTVEMLWLGLLLQSGNDAANVLARLGGGSVVDGVAAMNAEAQRLGAYQTHAVTPSGYDAAGQFTSAYDLALIARACFADAAFGRYALTQSARMPAQSRKYKAFEFQNQNQLIYDYPGALGGKTGFTDLARHTYVGAALRGDRRLVVTMLGAEYWPQPTWQQGAALLDWGFGLPADAAAGRLVEPGETVASPPPSPANPTAGPLAAADAVGDGWSTSTAVALGLAAAGLVAMLAGLLRRARRKPDG